MRTPYRFLAFSLLVVFLPLLAFADGNDDQERNRKLLEKARSDPQHYARLIQDLQAFMSLPQERQEELRKLDRDLHDEDSANYARLQRALERYNDWLQRLPEADRKKIEAASDTKARVHLIKEVREREWISRLPRVRQEQLAKVQSDHARYQALIKELRQEERNRHREWVYAIKNWNDIESGKQALFRLQKLKPELTVFVKDGLAPLLSDAEKQRLKAEFDAADKRGQWIEYFTTLVELADRHPTNKHPPTPNIGPRQFDELPGTLQARLKNATSWPPPAVTRAEGKWPEFALEVTNFSRANRIILPKQLGPSKLEDFAPSVQDFCTKQLFPVLSETDRDTLRNRGQGLWPAYPNRLTALARKHKMQIPGMGLPGSPDIWRPFRNRVKAAAEFAGTAQASAPAEELPDVPDRTLREFIQKELTSEEQAQLPSLSLSDPETRDLIKQRFFQRNPDVLERLQKADLKKQMRKAKGPKK